MSAMPSLSRFRGTVFRVEPDRPWLRRGYERGRSFVYWIASVQVDAER
jgi:hypothetical protein